MTKQRRQSQTRSRKSKRVTVETVRRLALALPGVEEGQSSGAPAFRVRGKLIAQMHRDGESLLVKIDYFNRDILMNADKETFYTTEFYNCYPMMYVRLAGVEPGMMRELLERAWRMQAPKRLIEAFDRSRAGE